MKKTELSMGHLHLVDREEEDGGKNTNRNK